MQAQYYHSLKDLVKDEISRFNKLDDLTELIALIVKINNRLFKRSLEKQGVYLNSHKKGQ